MRQRAARCGAWLATGATQPITSQLPHGMWHAIWLSRQVEACTREASRQRKEGCLCMQQLTVVSLVFALFMMDALRTAGVLPCSVSMALVLCALGAALIAFIAEAIEASASSTSLSAAV